MSKNNWHKNAGKAMALVCALGMMGSLAGCTIPVGDGAASEPSTGTSQVETQAEPAAKEGRELNMVFIAKSGSVNFFTDMMDRAQEAADLLPNVKINCQAPETGFDANQQLELIEQAINEGVDAVLCTAADATTISEGVKKCNDAGILYVAPNSKVNEGNVLTWIGIENEEVGYTLAKALCEKLGGKGNIVIFENKAGNQTCEDRVKGFMRAIEEYPDITVLDSQPADHDREKGMQVMENFLQTYPQIDGTLATSKDMTLGALEAAKAAGRNDKMVHVTFDIDD
ncbi:MAG: sugar ABC transporter substrate-binding protein, partial [Ruthenibacterium sp.]